MKISVVLNTYNAERHLERVLDSVRGFDEILVCDMESTDGTLQIARRHGCRVETFRKNDVNICEPARDFAVHRATHPWVLVVDADELVTKELHDYLYRLISRPSPPAGLYIPRKNFFFGKYMRCWSPDYTLRFMARDKTFWPPVIHSTPVIDGPVEKAPLNRNLDFIHLANESISSTLQKTDSYTAAEAERRKDRKYSTLDLLLKPLARFFKMYILKGGCLDGREGFIRACMDAYYQFIIIAKIYELQAPKLDASKWVSA